MHRYQIGDQPKTGLVVIDVIPGGMGVIYVVELKAPGGSLKMAIKSCDVAQAFSPSFRERVQKEGLLWISLPPHPRIIRAHSFEIDGGLPSLMMDYAPGGNLRDRMAKPMAVGDVLQIAAEFCDGMAFLADHHRILHLDIKPENVLFDLEGHVKITDFGLARAYEKEPRKGLVSRALASWKSRTEEPHVLPGTLPYMSPEQLSGREVDTRSDIYAFGVMLYEMLAGRRPFEADDGEGYARAIAKADVAALPEGVPPALRRLALRCLSQSPRKRFASFSNLRAEILALCTSHGVVVSMTDAPPDPNDERSFDAGDWNNRGYAFAQSQEFDEALRCYRRGIVALETEPRSENVVMTPGVDKRTNASDALYATLYTNMGALLMRMNRVNEAKEAFESARKAVPDDGVAHLRLGQLALQEGRTAEGLALLRRSIECEPGNTDFVIKYLRACLSLGESKEAEQSFEAFIAAKRTDGPFLVGMGCLLDEEFGLGPALRCFDAALAFDEDMAAAWYNKGVALQRAGEDVLAMESYRNAVRLNRGHPFARFYLAVLLIRHGMEEEGTANLRKFAEEAEHSPLVPMVATMLNSMALGVPSEAMLAMFRAPQMIKHAL